MHGFLGVHQLPDYISYPLSYITIIVVVNAFNLIDGVDGLL
jgi:UDP-N-acetylmuramyl pentapeptide phosphotransferase/UDP-N-acetylglucosamine-1-phosphate transferase